MSISSQQVQKQSVRNVESYITHKIKKHEYHLKFDSKNKLEYLQKQDDLEKQEKSVFHEDSYNKKPGKIRLCDK